MQDNQASSQGSRVGRITLLPSSCLHSPGSSVCPEQRTLGLMIAPPQGVPPYQHLPSTLLTHARPQSWIEMVKVTRISVFFFLLQLLRIQWGVVCSLIPRGSPRARREGLLPFSCLDHALMAPLLLITALGFHLPFLTLSQPLETATRRFPINVAYSYSFPKVSPGFGVVHGRSVSQLVPQ